MSSWDAGLPVSTTELDWSQLTADQQRAAEIFGYTQQSWDEERVDEQPSDSEWENYSWSELPENVQEAAQVIGYDECSWDNGLPVFTHELYWSQLTAEQQSAAETFGYNQQTWDNGENAPVTEWGNYSWSDLPECVQDAAQLLGYELQSWDAGLSVATEELNWEELTDEQQRAANILGYTQQTWDSGGDPSNSTNWDDYSWSELPPDIQEDAQILGYDINSWDGGLPISTDDLSWSQLTLEQQRAAQTFGYTEQTWNSEGSESWDNYGWSELPENIRESAEVLGYDMQIWDDGLPLPTEDLYWSQLTSEQQRAAEVLGYTQEAWDFEGYDDDYIFQVFPPHGSWVSQEMTIYFSGALCFVVVGILDWIRERHWLHVFMIIAGLMGLVSSMLVEVNLNASMILNCVSAHFFLLEALSIMRHRTQQAIPRSVQYVTWLGDGLFAVGAVLDVVLSYFSLNETNHWNLTIVTLELFAAVLWLACSLMYICVTAMLRMEMNQEATASRRTSSELKKEENAV